MLSVKTNLLAANADRQLKTNTKKKAKITEKLSSGYRINRAADDAAGLAISEKMRRQIRGLHQSVDNINDGIGYVQTAEGALNEVHDMLQRINELAVKSANGTNTEEDRSYIDREVQALKGEIDRIFDETSFNERKIWDPDEIESPNGGKTPLVTEVYTGKRINLTNDNYAVLPINTQQVYDSGMGESRYCTGDFTINADESGITVEWDGYNQKHYKTTGISWTELKDKSYRFDISDYFDKSKPELFNSQGAPVFTYEIAFNPSNEAKVKDICDAIDQKKISVETYNPIQGSWEGAASNSSGFQLNGFLNYWAVYDSHESSVQNKHSFGNDDLFLEPVKTNGTNLTAYPACTDVDAARNGGGWTFKLNLEGIGNVTASSTRVRYCTIPPYKPEDEGTWWYTYYPSNGSPYPRQYYKRADGTLAGVMDALDGANGLLSPPPDGISDPNRGNHHGDKGRINIGFRLTSENDGREVGVCTLSFDVSKDDTMQDVLDRINEALNGNTILDFETITDGEYSYISYLDPNTEYIDTTRGFCNFFVQAGTESGQHISIKYDALSIYVLKMRDTNVLTVEDSDAAIDEVKNAMRIVSQQRSDFGAYQNRLEHADNINANVEENTQASESVIRDTDIAEMMMEYSVNNILMQAGTSMLTQANQSKQLILELLN